MDLDTLISTEKLGYAHKFGDKLVLSRDMITSADKSKVEGKYKVTVKKADKEEVVDYLTGKDLIALQNNKRIECTWVKSKYGKPYWNHSSSYLDEEVLA